MIKGFSKTTYCFKRLIAFSVMLEDTAQQHKYPELRALRRPIDLFKNHAIVFVGCSYSEIFITKRPI
jgi:hypothetical protein